MWLLNRELIYLGWTGRSLEVEHHEVVLLEADLENVCLRLRIVPLPSCR
jgi:hypothetical protein|tara:strand:- start:321 stop:467 length:147 start_codon:yes stop_codon:yes gene_type:complete